MCRHPTVHIHVYSAGTQPPDPGSPALLADPVPGLGDAGPFGTCLPQLLLKHGVSTCASGKSSSTAGQQAGGSTNNTQQLTAILHKVHSPQVLLGRLPAAVAPVVVYPVLMAARNVLRHKLWPATLNTLCDP